MTHRSDTSLAAMLLTQRLVDSPAEPLKASEYWDLLDRVPDPAALLGLGPEAMVAEVGVAPAMAEHIAGLLDAAAAFAFALDEFEQSGLVALASVDDEYPGILTDRLGATAPPMLYCAGDPKLLAGNLLGIVGSRNVDEAGAEVARAAARAAASRGFGVASGGAKGVDRLAMNAALESGAPTVGVLADSLVRTTRDAEVRRAIADGLVCLCTAYKPTAGFSVANAMSRNKIIYALARATLVVATDVETGGTWAGATEALRRGIAPVVVWTGEGAPVGNERLAELGARRVEAMDTLFPLDVEEGSGRAPAPAVTLTAEQLPLGV